MSPYRASLLSLACLVLAGCSKDAENHPPEFHPDGTAMAPKTCGEVRKGEPSGGAILIEGGTVGCAAEGQECPVADVPAFTNACVKGLPTAVCFGSQWKLQCDLEAGLPEAGDAGTDATGDASGVMDASSD